MGTGGNAQSGAVAAGAGGSGGGDSKGFFQALVDGFVTVVMSLPVGARIVVALALVAVAGIGAYEKYKPGTNSANAVGAPPVIGTSAGGESYTSGNGTLDTAHPGADNSNPQNIEANHKAAEDDAAYKWHFNHLEDNPQEVALGDSSNPNEFLHYKYFAKSDKCLYVRRREGNTEYSQWLPDPAYSQHDIDRDRRVAVGKAGPQREMQASLASRLLVALAPVALAAAPQAGNCQNPHPGTFRYWWGKPIDACRSPMYREFQDGCTHYQVYNRCARSWENQINWTACKPPPHR